MSCPVALQLAEAPLPLFEHDDSQVELLSIRLFWGMMALPKEGAKPAEKPLHHSILPLFLHCHDKNQHVAEASWKILLCATKFLKTRHLKKLVQEEKLCRFGKCLDDSQVELLSIRLFWGMMALPKEGAKPAEKPLHHSILPLFLHCHDKNQHVAEASWKILLCATKFLKTRHLKKLVQEEKLCRFGKCLVRVACKPLLQPGESP
ncbi:hypothetical protein HGM15179_014592 [Zosterops borbonicus]|uniref:Maestro/Maestro-like HEAT-repeats domain-containing protein n=1 Tax=Zosterops borbonicus TaxID=364589 RepID=A0A8K1G6I6_9PASS|nr:hypothetical protein HGM15179_014592 [Zosterops borbonicus]